MKFSWEDYRKYRSDIQKWKKAGQIMLPPDEYAMVMSGLNTHMSEADRKKTIVVKPIGDYYYTIVNRGFDDYIIIGKRPIIGDVEEGWEDEE